MSNIHLGNSLFLIPSKHLVKISKSPSLTQSLLSYFKNNYDSVSSFPLNESQIDAWQNCIEVLGDAFSELPESYGKLSLVFEYVLPRHNPDSNRFLSENHIVADVIAVSADTVLVMEFKRRTDEFEGFFKQAGMYKRRLEKYHVESWDKDVEAILVLTNAEDYFSAEYYFGGMEGVVSCSPDRLAETLSAIFGEEVNKYPTFPAIGNWVHSEFRLRETEKGDYSKNPNKVKRMVRIAVLEAIELDKATNNVTAQINEINKKYDEGVISENEHNAQIDEMRARIKSVRLRSKNLSEFLRELSEKINDQKE